jgi:catechol 2,3-dioxygenase-like lactoylglutathione lyase family enzyme
MKATQVFESCLYAEDLEAERIFFENVLGLTLVSKMPGRGLAFRCGQGVVLIFDPRRTRIRESEIPTHGSAGPGHLAFLVQPEELPRWQAHLATCSVAIESEVTWPEGGTSVYFRDPAGNSIELAPPTLWGFNKQDADGNAS